MERARADLEQAVHLSTTPAHDVLASQLLAIVYLELKDLASYRSLLREASDLPLNLRSTLFAWGALLTEAQGLSPEVEVARTARISRIVWEFPAAGCIVAQGRGVF